MNIVDKIIQNLRGDSGAENSEGREKPDNLLLFPRDNGGRIWKGRAVTLSDGARAKAAYKKIYDKRWDITNVFDRFNADGSFTDALMGLDFFTAEEREAFAEICEGTARICSREQEKEFYRIIGRGYSEEYSAKRCGRPDLSVMRDISPEYYPYFLAVCAASGNGYLREEAQRLGAEYPIMLSIMISGFNDNLKEVRAAAEKAFETAMDRLEKAFEEGSGRLMEEITAPLFGSRGETGGEGRHRAMAALFRARRRLAEISKGGRYDGERLRQAEKRIEEVIGKNLNEDSIVYLSGRNKKYLKLIVNTLCNDDVLCTYGALAKKDLISCDNAAVIMAQRDWKWVRGRAAFMDRFFRGISYEGLVSFAGYRDKITRRCACVRLFEEYGLWEGAEKKLCDTSATVRETAAHYFEKLSDIDLHGFYMARLPEIPAIEGLAFCSRTDEQKAASAEAVRPLIDSENDRTAAAAVRCLAAVDGSEGIEREFYGLIKDPRPKTSKAALRAFIKAGKPLGCKVIYGDILEDIEVKKRQMKPWEREHLEKWREMPQMSAMNARRLTKALVLQRCSDEEKLPLALRLCVSENDGVRYAAGVYVSAAVKRLCNFKECDMAEVRQALEEIKPKGLGYWERKKIRRGFE
ncbi:MAG: hypothetical protein K2N72_05060, partial [Oscillospiraceae bacterium]|nr:hypothetical protein [Oscillospiraceae bacterium]